MRKVFRYESCMTCISNSSMAAAKASSSCKEGHVILERGISADLREVHSAVWIQRETDAHAKSFNICSHRLIKIGLHSKDVLGSARQSHEINYAERGLMYLRH